MATKNLLKLNTDVCIIGGGSVGMILSHLLTKMKINHLILEKEKSISNHPKAHYISPRSVEIFKNFDFITELTKLNQIEYGKYYRYCSNLVNKEKYYGEINHFKPSYESKLKYINEISDAFPMHLGQNKLNEILFNYLPKENIMMNQQVMFIGTNYVETNDSRIDAKYFIGCDGAHSLVRRSLGIEFIGDKSINSFINVHFISNKLNKKLKEIGKQSMLHFIFHPYYICVLISYDYDKGDYVLQVPCYDEVNNFNFDKDKYMNIIRNIINDISIDDIEMKEIKYWRMNNLYVEQWFKNNFFIIGDAAHQYPPSGGYGLNSGISDAFSLAWRLKYLLEKEEQGLISSYEKERTVYNKFISKCSNINFNKFLKICETLGLKIENTNILKNIISTLIPTNYQSRVFNELITVGIYLGQKFNTNYLIEYLKSDNNHIQLIFPYLDYGLNFKNESLNYIMTYEKDISLNTDVVIGNIIPNYLIPTVGIRLREYLKKMCKDSLSKFIILTRGDITDIGCISIFDQKILVKNIEYIIINDIIETINNIKYDIVIIRPDLIVEEAINL